MSYILSFIPQHISSVSFVTWTRNVLLRPTSKNYYVRNEIMENKVIQSVRFALCCSVHCA
jgi:hypothetical protein